MPAEVHLGVRPGRPTALLLFSAAFLVGMLALAGLQSRSARTLAEPVRVGDTPLVVRPPLGWAEPRGKPGQFVPPARDARRSPIDRSLRFYFERQSGFRSPMQIVEELARARNTKFLSIGAARIGPWDAVQVHRLIPFVFRNRRYLQEEVLRVACSPRGEIVLVEYLPLSEMTDADWSLLDEVCATVRLDEPAFRTDADAALRHAGVQLALADDWLVVGPEIPETPGFYIAGSVERMPAWSVGIFRTWLASGRTPRDLLTDFAEAVWEIPVEQAALEEWSRPDGLRVAKLNHPRRDPPPSQPRAVWFVGQAAWDAVLLLTYAGSQEAAAAAGSAATAEMARTITFSAAPGALPLEDAESEGRGLAELLTRAGAAPWWGRDPFQARYAATDANSAERLQIEWAAIERNPKLGYVGGAQFFRADGRDRLDRWRMDARALSYDYDFRDYYGGRQNPLPLLGRESRAADSATVRRELTLNQTQKRTRTFAAGPAFVIPPMELLAEAWVARQDQGVWLIQVSTLLGTGAHSRRLTPLPPDENGCRRVLIQEDYFPAGTIAGFKNDELAYALKGHRRMERLESAASGPSAGKARQWWAKLWKTRAP